MTRRHKNDLAAGLRNRPPRGRRAAISLPLLWLSVSAFGQQAVVPHCAYEGYNISDDGARCVPAPEFSNHSGSAETCGKLHGIFFEAKDGKPSECRLPDLPPQCPAIAGVEYSAKTKQCVQDKPPTPVSDPGDYVRDCLKPVGGIPGISLSGKETQLYVTGQSQDRQVLYVVPARDGDIFGCNPVPSNTPPLAIKLQDVVQSGALRSGWVYGALVAPFKFYPHSGEMSAAATIGPYLGWRVDRWAVTGTATTFVLSGGITSVIGTSKPADGESKSVPLTAWSLTGGIIFEVTKGKTPFRAGLLIGQDRVDRKSAVNYENNGRTWLALQLGYDFTDR